MLTTLKAVAKRVPFARRLAALVRRQPPDNLSGFDRNRLYDLQTVEIMKRVLAVDSTCVDVGAHHGALLAEMTAIAPQGVHYAFEPLPELAEGLRARFPNVRVHQCALCDRRGESSFEHIVNDPGYSGLRRRDYDRPDPQIEQITVATDTLDNLIPRDLHVGLIKIDVEGGEYHVLLGGTETIRRCRPLVIFEAAARSTGMYGVMAADLFDLITVKLGMKLSLMGRWLDGRRPYKKREFIRNWHHGPDFYFVAYFSRIWADWWRFLARRESVLNSCSPAR